MFGYPFCWPSVCLRRAVGATQAGDEQWKRLSDGILGRVADFEGAGGVKIAGYGRRPERAGPLPLVIVLHGGGPTARPVKAGNDQNRARLMAAEAVRASHVLGRASNPPIPDFLAQGWAVYSIDFRPNPRYMIDPLEFEDTVVAINKAKAFSFVDPNRIAMLGCSHGGHVTGRAWPRVPDSARAVLCPRRVGFDRAFPLGREGYADRRESKAHPTTGTTIRASRWPRSRRTPTPTLLVAADGSAEGAVPDPDD